MAAKSNKPVCLFAATPKPQSPASCHEVGWEVDATILDPLNKTKSMEKIHNCCHRFILPTLCWLWSCSAKAGLISCLQGRLHGAEQDIAEQQG